jgi:hypothetical protein
LPVEIVGVALHRCRAKYVPLIATFAGTIENPAKPAVLSSGDPRPAD